MTPPDTFKDKATLRAAILRDIRDAQNLNMFEIEGAFHQAMEEYATATLDADAEEELILYRVTWDEKHVIDLLAVSELDAMERAAAHRPNCTTRLDADNYQVEELEGD
jgi:membrane-bound ClpP family serine protease